MKEDYPIFVLWYQTLDWILATAENFLKNARFSVASRLVDAALDTMALIVEAIYTKERRPLLNRVNLLLEQQRVLFRVACDRRYISRRQHEYLRTLCTRPAAWWAAGAKTSPARSSPKPGRTRKRRNQPG